ncbi:MAG: glucose-1-phosphate adenylyltransferase [Ruminococcaceae bacterium]|nr:glucose-1-phosphate adenylyltransferase [Oscillospiraceae bacterium]
MYKRKECLAMLLAGGQGSRLYALTESTAKPAVTFGGKYRIIDFTLSNCINSNIDTVGVLTQYQPLVLNEYIGNGQPWDLDRTFGGVMVLPPYQAKNSADWYKGTANAIYQNLNFINRYSPEYVIILSGDHIYKMDYSKMLDFHKSKGADCTIAVIEVPLNQAYRFGIVNTAEDGRITEFEEKPKLPSSNKASMGIYIFNRKTLEDFLEQDEKDSESSNDFGKNVIPNMLKNNAKLYAYKFEGYWKDVGTLESLWEANMDIIGVNPEFNIHDKTWRIYSRTYAMAAQFIGDNASIKNSLITEGCEIDGMVENSVISSGVCIEKDAVVRNSVIMSGCKIKSGCTVDYSIIDSDTEIGCYAKIGCKNGGKDSISVIGASMKIAANTVINGGKMVSNGMGKEREICQ